MVFSMTNNQVILIKNIYHMLSYAFQVLKQTNYDEVASEDFENIQDLFSAILAKGIARQLKQGLYREYLPRMENLPVMRGKLDINGTIQNKIQREQVLSCEYNELTENNVFNQIIKTTATILMQDQSVTPERKMVLKKVLLFFDNIDVIKPSAIKWSMLGFHGGNQNYRMLLNVCYFVFEGLLLSTEKGTYKMATFLDEQRMSRLFEKFVLEYYRYHHPRLKASPTQISWDVDAGVNDFLPRMNTDITLKHRGKTLIIDTKYYARTMQTYSQFDSQTLHSHNLYQIFTYVKNEDAKKTGRVSGMLLYAKTNERITPDCDFKFSGNNISVKTLDLNTPFSTIRTQLDQVVWSVFDEGLQAVL